MKCHGLHYLGPTYISNGVSCPRLVTYPYTLPLAVVDKYSHTTGLHALRPSRRIHCKPLPEELSFETQLKHLQLCGATSDNTLTHTPPRPN